MSEKIVYTPEETDDPLRKIQLYQLEMLKELDRVCRENGLKYCLAYGTLLGAVRHKGFIPWDDDMDVRMPYRDIQALIKCWNSSRFSLQCPKNDIEMPFQYFKIRLNGSYMPDAIDEPLNINHGIWVDVFPYVDAAKSESGKKLQYFLANCLQSYRCRYLNRNKNGVKGSLNKVLCVFPKAIQVFFDNCIWKSVALFGCKGSEMYCHFGNGSFEQSFIKKDFCGKLTEIPFEDFYSFVPENYDEVLTFSYGDYMTPVKYSHLPDHSEVKFPE